MNDRKAETLILIALDDPYSCPCGNTEQADFHYEPEQRAEHDTNTPAHPPQVSCCICGHVIWEGQTAAQWKADHDEAREGGN